MATTHRTGRLPSDDRKRTAFLLCFLGGTGRGALPYFQSLYGQDDSPFPKHATCVDTEPGDTEGADSLCCIGLDPRKVDAIIADPALQGRVAKLIIERFPQFLDPHSIRDGSRTFRGLTQLAAEYHRRRIERHFKRCIREQMRHSGANLILPVFATSTGGGAGSALAVVLAMLFAKPRFRARILEGFSPYLMAPPVLIASEPFAYSLEATEPQELMIMSNAYALRCEVAELQRRGALQYVFLSGLANLSGAMLDTETELKRNLGSGVFALCRSWDYLKARFVDTVDTQKYMGRYAAHDVPEALFPDHVPSYGAPPSQRRRPPQITVTLEEGNGDARD